MASALLSARGWQRVRLAAVIATAAFALHQLRYLIAYGDSASTELAAQGHGYLAAWLPAIAVMTLAMGLATALRSRLAPGPTGGSLARLGLLLAGGLLVVYVTQESLEGLLAEGHPTGLAAIFGADGWIAFPLAVLIGSLSALLVRALEGVELALAPRRTRRATIRPPRTTGRSRPASQRGPSLSSLAFGQARRPPPAAA